MAKVKEAIDIITKEKLYCILNIYNDGVYSFWLEKGMESKDKYINIWTQIAKEFKDYNEYLIFESMDEVYFSNNYSFDYDYPTLINLNQAFVDTIRKSGGYNIERLLIIAGAADNLELTCNSNYKIPVDQSNKLAISIHYYSPFKFIYEYYYEPFNSTDDEGITVTYFPNIFWGNYLDYFRLFEDFKLIKSYFVDKGIPVILVK
jgi:endoglucanase